MFTVDFTNPDLVMMTKPDHFLKKRSYGVFINPGRNLVNDCVSYCR